MEAPQAVDIRNKIIGTLVRQARMAAGKTQRECADILGCSPSTFSYYERGHKGLALPELEALAYFFEVPLKALLDGSQAVEIVRIENPEFFLSRPSRTFHGRDIFAPVAARLAAGLELARLGPSMAREAVVCLPATSVRVSADGELIGEVVSIDRFGNLVTSIGQDRLASFLEDRQADAACFVVGRYRIDGLSASYDSVNKDQPLAIIGSRGVVEIAVNRASAQDRMEAVIGDAVRVVAGGQGGERGGRQ